MRENKGMTRLELIKKICVVNYFYILLKRESVTLMQNFLSL